ncbi:MATE family efflux transporter [Megasphaera hutchinsoni]|uniref:Probable multidrug resistance protein NorM n=1 Tax=Megasphaera hutchinsoni TaxID=1588748 RepID=A0A2J8BC98_9FIRM|nr:MATE family efflux transporter [Megasphaera genomosp. type_2]PNH22375.1 MATE family efflux transporter [Megasphaera genomosp. type_2]
MYLSSSYKYFITLFLPLLLTQAAQVGTNTFSSIFSGQASTIDLAGVAVAVNIWYPLFAGINGLFFGVSPIIAQLRGAEKTEEIPQYIIHSIYIAIFFTIFIIIFGSLCLTPFLNIMGLEPAVYHIAKHYLIALSFGILPIFIQATLRYIVDAHGMTRISMGILLINLLCTLILFRLLIFGAGPIPALGGIGTGYAITIASWISCLLFLSLFKWYPPFSTYRIHHLFPTFKWYYCLQELKIGIPIFIAVFCESSLFSIVGLLMAEFGTVYIAANQAAISYSTFLYTFPWSISLAATILIGYEVGAKRYDGARQYARLCQITALGMSAFFAILTYHFTMPISHLFTNDPITMQAISHFLFFAMMFTIVDAAGTPLQGMLRGYKDVTIITYVAFITYWLISIPLGYSIAHYTHFGPYGYWISSVISLTINAIALNYRLWGHTAYPERQLNALTK